MTRNRLLTILEYEFYSICKETQKYPAWWYSLTSEGDTSLCNLLSLDINTLNNILLQLNILKLYNGSSTVNTEGKEAFIAKYTLEIEVENKLLRDIEL